MIPTMGIERRIHARWESRWVDGPPAGDDPGAVEEEALRQAAGERCPSCGNDDTSAMEVDLDPVGFRGWQVVCAAPHRVDPDDTCAEVIALRDYDDKGEW